MPTPNRPTLVTFIEPIEPRQPIPHKTAFLVNSANLTKANIQSLDGTLVSGQLSAGDEVRITASGKTAKISNIITSVGDSPCAKAGQTATLILDRVINASCGDVIALSNLPLDMTDHFEATLHWSHHEPGLTGRSYELKLANQKADASITKLKYRTNVDTLAQEPCRQLALNDIAVVNLALSKPLVFDTYIESKTLGSFIMMDKFTHATVANGTIQHNLRRAQNVHRQDLSISRKERERLNGHEGKVIWFTGLSGSGKSTIANALEKELHAQGKRTYILDGDNIRQGLNKDLGFTDQDRVENIRRIAEVAKLMMDAGLIVITAFISPFRAERQMARELIGSENFYEVFVDTPLKICEERDPKGLYKRARNGQIPNMTGINSPYERPERPDFMLSDENLNPNMAVDKLLGIFASP